MARKISFETQIRRAKAAFLIAAGRNADQSSLKLHFKSDEVFGKHHQYVYFSINFIDRFNGSDRVFVKIYEWIDDEQRLEHYSHLRLPPQEWQRELSSI